MVLLQTLYIFGNGFDIAHGIKTLYAAFREFLKENHESFLTTFESMYNIQPLDDTVSIPALVSLVHESGLGKMGQVGY